MGSTRPMWIGLGWVGLDFFLPTMVGWVKKSPQPDPCTPLLTMTTQLTILYPLDQVFCIFLSSLD